MQSLGQTTRAYVSAYQRDRVHRSRLVRGEKRVMQADFNGALLPDQKILSATWRCLVPGAVNMSDASIAEDQRSTSIIVTANVGWAGAIKAQVTIDDGSIMNQLFDVSVMDMPWFQGDPWEPAGPYTLSVVFVPAP